MKPVVVVVVLARVGSEIGQNKQMRFLMNKSIILAAIGFSCAIFLPAAAAKSIEAASSKWSNLQLGFLFGQLYLYHH